MHNVNPINSNMALITENIMGHNSCAQTNGIITCAMQQPAPRAGKERGVSELNPPQDSILPEVQQLAAVQIIHIHVHKGNGTKKINPLFALPLMWQNSICACAVFCVERKLRAQVGNTRNLVRRQQ